MDSILLVTSDDSTGGTLYEKDVYKLLNNQFEAGIYQYSQSKYKYYPNKIFIYNQLKNIKGNYKILITNLSFIYGLNLKIGNKKILIFHHFDFKNEKLLNKLFWKSISKKLNSFDKIICVSEYWRKFILEENKYLKQEDVHIISNCFDVSKFDIAKSKKDRMQFCNKYNIPADKILVYAGNSGFHKGTDRVVAALDRKKYHIITSGVMSENYGTHHLSLSYDDYLELLVNVDVTVILSRLLEGWNRIAHESLLAGTPVIGSGVAGLGELLYKAGQCIYNENSKLDEQIEYVLNNKEKIMSGCYNYVRKFDLKFFGEEWNKIITEYL
ncbi:MAG: glycosyltransferase [Melioribacter sp.]|uniref:glycosyltransferase n=1 Tax=Melioribacter sp. TaxID=2052167 RepID=UPI003BBCBDB6